MTKEIPLTQGKYAKVDDQDYAAAAKLRWHWTPAGASTNLGGRQVLLHRFILQPPEDMDVVHLNSNKADCRRENMQLVERGLAQWVDRNAYGLNSMIPVGERVDRPDVDYGRTPVDLADAVALKAEIQASQAALFVALNDYELTRHLNSLEKQIWRKQMWQLTELRVKQRDAVKLWLVQHNRSLAEAAADRRETHRQHMTTVPQSSDEKARKRHERFLKWEARMHAAAAMREENDPVGLLQRCITLLSRLEHEGRVVYSGEERGFMGALSDYLQNQEVSV
jgi:hypothetical protein